MDMENIADLVRTGNSAIDALKGRIDDLETKTSRPGGGFKETKTHDEHSEVFANWLRDPNSDTKRRALADIEAKQASSLTDAAGGFIVPELIAHLCRPLRQGLHQSRSWRGCRNRMGRSRRQAPSHGHRVQVAE